MNTELHNALHEIFATCETHHTPISTTQKDLLLQFVDLLVEKNKHINLMSRKLSPNQVANHILHSISISFFHSFQSKEEVIDIGTGGGLPGIPLAILFPETRFTLVDSIHKKINACQEFVNILQLKNVTTRCLRVNDIRDRKFHTAISRQAASLVELSQWCRPLLREEGTLIALKGGDIEDELTAALEDGAEYVEFPAEFEIKPLDNLGEDFSGKCIVILK